MDFEDSFAGRINRLVNLNCRFDSETITKIRKDLLDGKCMACGHRPDNLKELAIDHDHETGKYRGVLCHSCNKTLGMAKDSLERLASLMLYLEDSQTIDIMRRTCELNLEHLCTLALKVQEIISLAKYSDQLWWAAVDDPVGLISRNGAQ